MVVVSKVAPSLGHIGASRSPTMVYPPNQARVADAMAAAGGWTHMQQLNGVHGYGMGIAADGQSFMASIPQWTWWGLGGVGIGLVGGFLFFGKKRR